MPRAIDEVLELDAEGRFCQLNRLRWLFVEYIKLFAPGDVRIRISRPQRSTAANRYYWGVVIKVIRQGCLEAGQVVSAEALHEHFKARYLDPRVVEVLGKERVLPPSTVKLDSTAFYDYIESIKTDEDVVQLGVYIPPPDDGRWKSYSLEEP